jgi:2-polyprenyl-3-methyl-5-hydroxy-6-metoxy-1,4-benzoquinol methylase|tara:strand:+ start:1455 stop:1811 length:357 start_codon:yes stop_codon:yes gene_type:complete
VTSNSKQEEIVKNKFNIIWDSTGNDYSKLVSKMEDPDYVVREAEHGHSTISVINRACMAGQYIMNNYDNGSSVVEVACGNGFFACYMVQQEYDVVATRVCVESIERKSSSASTQAYGT